MKNILGINKFNFVAGIVAAAVTGTVLVWIVISAPLYYGFGVALIVTGILGLIKQKKACGLLAGNIMFLIAACLHTLSGLLAVPAMILYIIAVIFIFKNKVI